MKLGDRVKVNFAQGYEKLSTLLKEVITGRMPAVLPMEIR